MSACGGIRVTDGGWEAVSCYFISIPLDAIKVALHSEIYLILKQAVLGYELRNELHDRREKPLDK